jgi:hypothetical protein
MASFAKVVGWTFFGELIFSFVTGLMMLGNL